jgi:hypothetical protein
VLDYLFGDHAEYAEPVDLDGKHRADEIAAAVFGVPSGAATRKQVDSTKRAIHKLTAEGFVQMDQLWWENYRLIGSERDPGLIDGNGNPISERQRLCLTVWLDPDYLDWLEEELD